MLNFFGQVGDVSAFEIGEPRTVERTADAADRIPATVYRDLSSRFRNTRDGSETGERLCRGTLLSRSQYLMDIGHWGYRDARLEPVGPMTDEELDIWTSAAEEETGPAYTDVEDVG